jgi:hypothetical protein
MEAKNRQKVAPSTFQCQGCNVLIYEGKSEKLREQTEERLDCEVIKGKTHIDHISPVVPITGFGVDKEWDWNLFIYNLFCPASGMQVLCESCHKDKTKYENEMRKGYRERNKIGSTKKSKRSSKRRVR